MADFQNIKRIVRHNLRRTLQRNINAVVAQPSYAFKHLLRPTGEQLLFRFLGSQHKWFIHPELTVLDFFYTLQQREVRYVVLRWWEDLPYVEPGHDIDILVADEHISRIEDLLTHWPIGQRCDVYSATGLPGFSYRPRANLQDAGDELPVLPPHLAQQVLRLGYLHKGLIRVPTRHDHFFSLAYHAVYLKRSLQGSHDYARVLTDLALSLGITLPDPITLKALDDFLAAHGWRPPPFMLAQLSHGRTYLPAPHQVARPEEPKKHDR
jgi:hypothetical protein